MKRLMALAATLFTSQLAFAAEGVATSGDGAWIAMAVGIGMGLAALGGTLGQGRAASAALEGIARNPNAADKLFTPMILGLALIESLVLFSWLMMFFLQGKL